MEPVFSLFAGLLAVIMPLDIPKGPAVGPGAQPETRPAVTRTCQASYARSSYVEERMGQVVHREAQQSGGAMRCGEPLDSGFDDLKARVLASPGRREF